MCAGVDKEGATSILPRVLTKKEKSNFHTGAGVDKESNTCAGVEYSLPNNECLFFKRARLHQEANTKTRYQQII